MLGTRTHTLSLSLSLSLFAFFLLTKLPSIFAGKDGVSFFTANPPLCALLPKLVVGFRLESRGNNEHSTGPLRLPVLMYDGTCLDGNEPVT